MLAVLVVLVEQLVTVQIVFLVLQPLLVVVMEVTQATVVTLVALEEVLAAITFKVAVAVAEVGLAMPIICP